MKLEKKILELTNKVNKLQNDVKNIPKPALPQFPCKMFGNFHALIIANFDYEDKRWPDLDTPKKDAEKIAAVLENRYFFETEVILNAKQDVITSAIMKYRKKLNKDDNLLIYYAGHGFLDEKLNRGYWIPVDGSGSDEQVNWISCPTINDYIALMEARHVLVVVDSCHSGRLTRNANIDITGVEDNDKARKYWVEEMAARSSRSVITSGDLRPVLDIGGGGHSIFAKHFIKVLLKNSKTLTANNLHMEIRAPIYEEARKIFRTSKSLTQEPQYQPLRFARHESGEFFFCPQRK